MTKEKKHKCQGQEIDLMRARHYHQAKKRTKKEIIKSLKEKIDEIKKS